MSGPPPSFTAYPPEPPPAAAASASPLITAAMPRAGFWARMGALFLDILLVGVVMLVVMFQTSNNLSHAYGLAVTGTMLVTTTLAYIVVRRLWRWGPLLTAALIGPLLAMDLTFLCANVLKILSGGWVPVLIGLGLSLVMLTWVRGTQLLFDKTRRDSVPLKDLADILKTRAPHRVPGTAIFLTSDADVAPVALMHNLKHNKVLHEKNVILTVATAETPRVRDDDRVRIDRSALQDDRRRDRRFEMRQRRSRHQVGRARADRGLRLRAAFGGRADHGGG